MSGIDLVTAENAIFAWVCAGSGLDDDHVLWAEQVEDHTLAVPAAGLWISMRLRAIGKDATDWRDLSTNPASNGHDAIGIIYKVRGPRTLALELRAYRGGLVAACAALDGIRTARRLPSVVDILRAANVGIGPMSAVSSADGYVGAAKVFEPRAMLDATIHVVSELIETGANIEHVNVTNEITGEVITIDGPPLPP